MLSVLKIETDTVHALFVSHTSKCGLRPRLLHCTRSAVEMCVTMDSTIGSVSTTAKVRGL